MDAALTAYLCVGLEKALSSYHHQSVVQWNRETDSDINIDWKRL